MKEKADHIKGSKTQIVISILKTLKYDFDIVHKDYGKKPHERKIIEFIAKRKCTKPYTF